MLKEEMPLNKWRSKKNINLIFPRTMVSRNDSEVIVLYQPVTNPKFSKQKFRLSWITL